MCLALILAAIPFVGGCGPAAPERVELTAVSLFPVMSPEVIPLGMLKEKVEAKTNGDLTINWLGGPEVIDGFDQGSAVQNAVVDMSFLFSGSHAGLVPATEVLQKSTITPEQELEVGAWDLMNKEYNKAGLFFLGRHGPTNNFFYVLTNKKVARPQDLAGQRLGDGTIGRNFLSALGAIPVTTDYAEAYTSVERGVLDGWAFPLSSLTFFGFHEVNKYVINHPFLSNDMLYIINLDKWNSLPSRFQDVLIEAKAEIDAEWPPIYDGISGEVWQEMMKTMEVITFSPADVEFWYQTAYSAEWTYLYQTIPDIAPNFKGLLWPGEKLPDTTPPFK